MPINCSKSLKVIDFCTNGKPICDFLLVINYDLHYISHRFQDISLRSSKTNSSSAVPDKGDPFEFLPKAYHTYSQGSALLVTMYNVTDRQTTTTAELRNCNIRLKNGKRSKSNYIMRCISWQHNR